LFDEIFSKKVSNVVVTLSPLDGLLEVVGGHPEFDEGSLALPLHKLHEVEQGRVVEQNVRYKNLKKILNEKKLSGS
jgi:hypothetical protein